MFLHSSTSFLRFRRGAVPTGRVATHAQYAFGQPCRSRPENQATKDQTRPRGYDASVKPFGFPVTDKLLVGAARGAVRGAGGHFFLGCDVRVASRTMTYAVNEVRTGVLGPYWLAATEKLPHPIAFRLAVIGETFTATEVEPYGLFTEVVEDAELESATEAWVQRLLELPRHHAVATNRLMHLARGFTDDQARAEIEVRLELDKLSDTVEGALAFAERRAPSFGTR